MKPYRKLAAFAAVLVVALLCACTSKPNRPREFEGYPVSDMSGYPAFEGFGGELVFYDLTVADIQQRMENGDSFAFIAAFSGCPWCNLCIAQLNDAALAEGMHVGYLNTRLDPSWTSNIDIDDYDIFVELFGDYLREDDDGILHLYTPHVFFIKDGQVVAEHSSPVEGADPSQGLTEEQSQELIGIYREGFEAIK